MVLSPHRGECVPMLFNSLTFAVFFAALLGLHNLPLPWRVKKINLLLASYLFYAAWSPPFVILLWISTAVDWKVAAWISASHDPGRRKLILALSLVANLGFLGYFKYGTFLMDNFALAARVVGIDYVPPKWDIVLPVGISFYTFQSIAYSLDVYLGRAQPTRRFLDFALFVTFFPHLVAGPIVRPTLLIPQFEQPRRASREQLIWGLALMTLGLFEKVVLADGFLAPVVDAVQKAPRNLDSLDAWTGAVAFSGQIFFDFAGYSTTAIGAALALGFALNDNFNFPYAAVGFSDFWRRWHISLSTWLRDYLYVPLGGNRHGELRTYINLMITMLLGGLWHGASWTFVAWGGLHGAYLAIERWLRSCRVATSASSRTSTLGMLGTFLVVTVTWVFFRAHTFADAAGMLRSMAGVTVATHKALYWNDIVAVGVIAGVMLATHWRLRSTRLESVVSAAPTWTVVFAWTFMAFALVAEQGAGDAFIYFEF
ncbi:MAG: alginate O-acetyltransferase complex protein AlgI [Gammaproteobacteria bacterium]|nr:alginate O-acetyltransferase complex protein AlgI [Gammaproteobacteria bacterium]